MTTAIFHTEQRIRRAGELSRCADVAMLPRVSLPVYRSLESIYVQLITVLPRKDNDCKLKIIYRKAICYGWLLMKRLLVIDTVTLTKIITGCRFGNGKAFSPEINIELEGFHHSIVTKNLSSPGKQNWFSCLMLLLKYISSFTEQIYGMFSLVLCSS